MQTIFNKIKIWVVDNKSILTNFTVAVFLMSTIILFYRREKCRADDISNDYLLPLIKGDSILLAVVSNSVLKDSLAKKNLVNNVLLIQEEKKHHKAIFTNLFSYYYATIIILQLLTVATGIFTFLIANKGWKDTNQTLKLTFLILAGATTYYGLFPSIFNQKTTIEKNLSSYLEYSKIQLRIYNYCITESLGKGDTSFFNGVNRDLLKRKEIYFGVDDTPIERQNFINGLNGDE